MANPEHVAKLKEGAEAWNTWFENTRTSGDLSKADLRGVTLNGFEFVDADLKQADMSTAQIFGSGFVGAKLTQANLKAARVIGTTFRGADLKGADLSEAHLYEVDFTFTNLAEADFSLAEFLYSILGSTDLTHAKGLESCHHSGPSIVGIDTVFKSGGTIPENFLRGCGVPEQFITYARSLILQPIGFYSCFISYSVHDEAFAERLNADLRANGLRSWFAPEDLRIGDRFQERIEESIRLFDKVMIILSDASVQSRWVEREVNAAREREDRENRTVLFPIRIDEAVMTASQPWAADVRRSRHIGDFSSWKEYDLYQKALQRLLRDLRAQTAGATGA